MYTSRQAAVQICACFALLLACHPALAFDPPAYWMQNFEEARQAAKNQQEPALIYFYSNKVRPCREFEQDTLQNPDLEEQLSGFVRAAVNAPENPQLARTFRFFKVPTVIFLSPSGQEIDRAVGYKMPDEFKQYLSRIQTGASEDLEGREQMAPFQDTAVDILNNAPNRKVIPLRYHAPDAQTIHVVGDFNDWRTDATLMKRQPSGEWTITIYLREGIYEYMFYVDDSEYVQDPNNNLSKPNPYGGMNSVLKVGNPKTSPIIQGQQVTFILYRPEASKIEVAGNFTNWEPVLMFRNENDLAMWGVQYRLPPGQYAYKYVIDGEWQLDPENYHITTDPDGNMNSIFRIE